jgi:hypothetical protein
MYDNIANEWKAECNALLPRIAKGESVLAGMDKTSPEYFKALMLLRQLTAKRSRLSACVAILNGDLNLLLEQGDNVVVILKGHHNKLLDAVRAIGGEIVYDKCIIEGKEDYDCHLDSGIPASGDCKNCPVYIK